MPRHSPAGRPPAGWHGLAFVLAVAVLPLTATTPASASVAPERAHAVMTALTANLWIDNRRVHAATRTIRQLRPLVVGMQEGRETPRLRIRGYRKLGGPGIKRHNPVWIRRGEGVSVGRWYVVKVSERTGEGIYHVARYMTVVRLRWAGRRWSVINTHLPVVSRTKRPDPQRSQVAREYRAGFKRVLRVTKREHRAGRRVVLLGDLNDRPRRESPGGGGTRPVRCRVRVWSTSAPAWTTSPPPGAAMRSANAA